MRKFLLVLMALVTFSLGLNAIPYRSNEPIPTPEQIVLMATTPNIFAAQWDFKTVLFYSDGYTQSPVGQYPTECEAREAMTIWLSNPNLNRGYYTSAWYYSNHGGWWTHADVYLRESPNAYTFINHTNYGVAVSFPQCGDPEPDSIPTPQRPK